METGGKQNMVTYELRQRSHLYISKNIHQIQLELPVTYHSVPLILKKANSRNHLSTKRISNQKHMYLYFRTRTWAYRGKEAKNRSRKEDYEESSSLGGVDHGCLGTGCCWHCRWTRQRIEDWSPCHRCASWESRSYSCTCPVPRDFS